jgi:hypothetical protein
MKSVIALLLVMSLCLSPVLSRVALADPLLAAAPARKRLRREKVIALAFAGSIVGLGLSGGMLIAESHGYDFITEPGLALGLTGIALALPTLELGVYTAGHDQGLHLLPVMLAADPAKRGALLDDAEAAAHQEERVGISLLVSGLILFGAGLGMLLGASSGVTIGPPDGSGTSGGNGPLFVAGVATSVIGDALWFSGMLVWTHGGGRHRGVRETRAALAVTPVGIAGQL